MSGLAVLPVLESEKQAIDQGHLHGLFAFKLFLPPEMLDELLLTATDLWRTNGCEPRLIELAMEAARAAYRGEVSWLAELASTDESIGHRDATPASSASPGAARTPRR
jgi:hypothetical protein